MIVLNVVIPVLEISFGLPTTLKAITAEKHKLSPCHGSHSSQFLGGDEDCGDDDDDGSHFHNRNNLNRDELGGALPP